jgi:hypothetical protein
MNLTSSTYRLTLTEVTGEFEVFPLADRQLHVTEFENGVKTTKINPPDPATQRLLAHANRVPLFSCNFAGDGWFNLDLDCGMARWNGQKSEKDVRTALRRCGFSLKEARAVIVASKVETHRWIARVA